MTTLTSNRYSDAYFIRTNYGLPIVKPLEASRQDLLNQLHQSKDFNDLIVSHQIASGEDTLRYEKDHAGDPRLSIITTNGQRKIISFKELQLDLPEEDIELIRQILDSSESETRLSPLARRVSTPDSARTNPAAEGAEDAHAAHQGCKACEKHTEFLHEIIRDLLKQNNRLPQVPLHNVSLDHVATHQAEVAALKQQIAELTAQVSSQQVQIESKDQVIGEKDLENEALRDHIDQLEQALISKQDELIHVGDQRDHLALIIVGKEDQLARAHTMIGDLGREALSKTKQIEELDAALATLDHLLSERNGEFESLEEQHEHLFNSFIDLGEQNTRLGTLVDELHAQIAGLKQTQEQDLASVHEINRQLNEELASLRTELAEVTGMSDSRQAEIEELLAKVEAAEAVSSQLLTLLQDSRAEVTILKEKLEASESECAALRDALLAEHGSREASDAKTLMLEARLRGLEEQNSQIAALLSAANERADDLEANLASSVAANNRSEKELAALRIALQASTFAIEGLGIELEDERALKAQTNGSIRALEAQLLTSEEENQALRTEIEELRAQLSVKNVELQSSKKDLHLEKLANAELVANLTGQLEDRLAELKALQALKAVDGEKLESLGRELAEALRSKSQTDAAFLASQSAIRGLQAQLEQQADEHANAIATLQAEKQAAMQKFFGILAQKQAIIGEQDETIQSQLSSIVLNARQNEALVTELQNLRETEAALRAKLTSNSAESEQNTTALRKVIAKQRELIDFLKDSLNALKSEMRAFSSDAEINFVLNQLQNKLAEADVGKSEQAQKIREIQDALATATAKIEEGAREKGELEAALAKISSQYQSLVESTTAEKLAIERQKAGLEAKVQSLTGDVTALRDELSSTQTSLAAMTTAKNSLADQLAKLQLHADSADVDNALLKEDLATAERALAQKEKLAIRTQQKFDEALGKAAGENQSLTRQLQQFETLIAQKDIDIERLEKAQALQISELRGRLDLAEAGQQALRIQLRDAKTAQGSTELELAKLHQEIRGLEAGNEDLKSSLKSEIGAKKALHEQVALLKAQLANELETIGNLESTIRSQQALIVAANAKIEEIEPLKAALRSAQDDSEYAVGKAAALEKKYSALERSSRDRQRNDFNRSEEQAGRIAELETDLRDLRAQLIQAESRRQELVERRDQLQGRVDHLLEVNSAQENTIRELRAEIHNLNELLKANMANIQSLTNDFSQSQAHNGQLQSEMQTLMSSLDHLQSQMDGLDRSKRAAEEEVIAIAARLERAKPAAAPKHSSSLFDSHISKEMQRALEHKKELRLAFLELTRNLTPEQSRALQLSKDLSTIGYIDFTGQTKDADVRIHFDPSVIPPNPFTGTTVISKDFTIGDSATRGGTLQYMLKTHLANKLIIAKNTGNFVNTLGTFLTKNPTISEFLRKLNENLAKVQRRELALKEATGSSNTVLNASCDKALIAETAKAFMELLTKDGSSRSYIYGDLIRLRYLLDQVHHEDDTVQTENLRNIFEAIEPLLKEMLADPSGARAQDGLRAASAF